jgi:acyl-CoA synthetase (AMP-forming)/AMP-acid ligase II
MAGERAYTFAEVSLMSAGVASSLRSAGHGAGTKCAVLAHNDPVAFTCTLGVLRAGGVWVPLNPRNTPSENAWLLESFDCEVLFFQEAFAQAVSDFASRLPLLKTLVCIDAEITGCRSLDDWLVPQADISPFADPAPEAPALIVPTGGTTGRPKGVVLTNRNIAAFCANVLSCLHFDAPPVCLACAPLTHAAGIFAFPMMAIGATHIVHAAVDPSRILAEIERSRVSFLFLPPTAIYALLSHPEVGSHDYRSLKYLLYGASPIAPSKLKEAIDVFGPVMAQMFGQSEAPASITFLAPEDHFDAHGNIDEARLRSCGAATPFARAEIMNENGDLLGVGEVGEIVVRGDLVMSGYYRDVAATEASRTRGWHRTGDLGYRDENGFFYIVDRKKDMIITGGLNVFATEVEQTIMQHPDVQECAVIGIPDDKWGEAVKAFVEPKSGARLDPAELRDRCRTQLGGVKAPKSIEIVEELPRSSVGKVLKRQLRDQAWAGFERRI